MDKKQDKELYAAKYHCKIFGVRVHKEKDGEVRFWESEEKYGDFKKREKNNYISG